MIGKALCIWMAAFFLIVIPVFCPGAGAAGTESPLIGTTTTNFSLSSSQDRLIKYGKEYYGRHHLIITFFPAAFTPV